MSDDEDGLPRILLNSSTHSTGAFSIPSAEELASQREREIENQRKLRELQERHASEEDVGDSYGSESDAALAAAVNGMRVGLGGVGGAGAARPAPRREPCAAALLAAIAPHLPRPAHPLFRSARTLPEVVSSASALVAADGEVWDDDEVNAVGALLGAATLAREGLHPIALRALHTLLEQRASEKQAVTFVEMMVCALPAARTRLALSDALRSGGGLVCESLATLVLDVALVELLAPPARGPASLAQLADAMEAGWARLAPEPRFSALQLLGRRLAAAQSERGWAEARARLLRPLAQAQIGHDTQTPEKLKVLVCASKLRLLFGTEK